MPKQGRGVGSLAASWLVPASAAETMAPKLNAFSRGRRFCQHSSPRALYIGDPKVLLGLSPYRAVSEARNQCEAPQEAQLDTDLAAHQGCLGCNQ